MSKRIVPIDNFFAKKLKPLENPFRDVPAHSLHNYGMELNALMAANTREAERLRLLISLVAEAERHQNPEDKKLIIADHAIVRYMERYEGYDFTRVEEAILNMVENGNEEVGVRQGVAITILPRGQTAVKEDRQYPPQ